MTIIIFSSKKGVSVVTPVLSSPSAGTPTNTGSTGASVSTDTGNGTLYWAVVTNGGSATNAQIKAGSGGNIVAGVAGSQSVSGTGTQTLGTISGLSAATTYQIIFLQTSAASVDSAQSSVSLTTSSITYATWNPSDKSANIVLTNGNLTMASNNNATGRIARSTLSFSTGKYYWEITVNAGTITDTVIGVATSAAGLNILLGNDAFGWGYYQNGQKQNNGSGTAYGASFTNGDVIGVAMDAGAGTITFYKNGSTQGQAFTGIGTPIFAAATPYPSTALITANFGATALTYSPPAGYNAGLYA